MAVKGLTNKKYPKFSCGMGVRTIGVNLSQEAHSQSFYPTRQMLHLGRPQDRTGSP
ncbi:MULTISPECIES: hypothetical protein [unclassified Nostoc]|uniref:hypothetical protein n=1 Tax=unclassified Nostoc TaxID=2593658 RepID=UPI0025EF6D2B|nr:MULTISPECIES: hypothetical protein [unclassified Nostoc]